MKENVMLEWEEKKKLLDISDEHTIHTTPFTPIAATVTETPCAFQHKRPVTTIVEFIADGLSPLSDCQQELGQEYYYLTYNDACRKRVVKQRMKHVHEVAGNVLLVVNLPDHSTDITETGAIWKNFMIAARINQNNGGSLLLNLPTESNWWSTRCMKKAQEELCFRMDEITWCSYGIASQGHLVDTRSSIASDCEFLLGKLWKPARCEQHSHISAKNQMAKCQESNMLHLPAEIATEIVSAWLSFVIQKPESQASAVPGGNTGTTDVPRMPCSASTQEPGPPSEPIGDLIAAIGAVAKLLTKAEIREDPEAQKAMDAEFYKLQGDGITGTWDLSQVRAKRDVMQEARKQEKTHIMVACLVSHR